MKKALLSVSLVVASSLSPPAVALPLYHVIQVDKSTVASLLADTTDWLPLRTQNAAGEKLISVNVTAPNGDVFLSALDDNGIQTVFPGVPNRAQAFGFHTITSASAINSLGQVIGETVSTDVDATSYPQAWVWRHGTTTALNGTVETFANHMNDLGQVVGRAVDPSDGEHAIVYDGGKTYFLDNFVDASSANLQLIEATAVSMHGQILGTARVGPQFDSFTDFLATPAVPEPDTAILLLVGLLGLTAWVRRTRKDEVVSVSRVPTGPLSSRL
jgi:hypothetical protein